MGGRELDADGGVAGAVEAYAAPPQAGRPSDLIAALRCVIAEIDARISAQLNAILHHPEFQALEASWRGLHYLASRSQERDELVKLRVLGITKAELQKSLRRYEGTTWDQSPLFKLVYEEEYGQFGGEPFGCLVGDYEFDHSPPDVRMLQSLAKVAAAAHCPFIAGVSPTLFQMDSWQELANRRDLTRILQTPEYAAWRSLREMEDARYLGLTLPRHLARLPYRIRSNPVDDFGFEEDTGGGHGSYLWANSAYAMAGNVLRSFRLYGWCASIRGVESGGLVEDLPCDAFASDDGGIDLKCPTEIAVSDHREAELAKNGLMPLVHRRNSAVAVFVGAQSLHRPPEYDDADATANAAMGARLPYLFAASRFAHYLKCIVRDRVGAFRSANALQQELQLWVLQYVDGDPEHSTEATKAERPLSAADVVVEEIEGKPGHYASKFFLRPHYQLEGLSVSLRLVSRLPAPKVG